MSTHRRKYLLAVAVLVAAFRATPCSRAQRAGAVGPLPPNQFRPEDFVRVTINWVRGPMGYISTPSLVSTSQFNGVNPQAILASQNSNFPSIILYISAVPVVYVPRNANAPGELDHLQAAQETNRNPLWLDASRIRHAKAAARKARARSQAKASLASLLAPHFLFCPKAVTTSKTLPAPEPRL